MAPQIGYIRVSTVDQNTGRQLDGIKLDKVFTEKISGKSIKRPELERCLEHLREGDTLHVHSMDRLARNLMDLQQVVEGLISKGVRVKFHKENLEFTGESNAMAKLMLQIMGAVAGFERALIHERQREGIQKAKEEGRPLGRKPALTEDQQQEMKRRAEAGEEKKVLAEEYGISRQSLYRILARMEKQPVEE